MTNAQVAAQLLREAAEFYHTLGGSSPDLKDRMEEFGTLYKEVAVLLDTDPQGTLADNSRG